ACRVRRGGCPRRPLVHRARPGALLFVSPRWAHGPHGGGHLDRPGAGVTHSSAALASIVVAALAGGVLSTMVAAATLRLSRQWVPPLVSFSVGALLGAVFLELVPHALETGSPQTVM